LSLNLENTDITQVDNLKYLGLTLDNRLRYDEYMKHLTSKLKRSLGVIRRASRYIDQVTRVTLYNTLILPHIDYCSTVWGNSVSEGDLKRLQRIQNAAMRIILQCHYRTDIADMLDTLQWLNVKQRLHFNLCCLSWKIQQKEVPEYLQNTVEVREVHTYNTRSASNNELYVSHSHNHSLKRNGTTVWNSVPKDLRDISNFRSFKSMLSKHIRLHVYN
jgi:hypothetical protein